MAVPAYITGNFKKRYGRWIDPLPDEHTLADFGDFVPRDSRPGLTYDFPVLTAVEHGQTADNSGTAFTLNVAIPSNVLNASLTGSTIMLRTLVPYDVIYASLNGTALSGSAGGAFKTGLDQSMEAMLMGAGLYRELALAWGPGTAAAIASDIGVVSSVTGTMNAGQTLTFTTASWIPGLWILGQNMKVDVYAADGSTIVQAGASVINRVDSSTARIVVKFVGGTNAAAGNRIIPAGWRTTSCVGLEGIYRNVGTLFNIDASTVAPWQCSVFSSGGALTRAKIIGYAAQISLNGCRSGGKLFVSAQTFATLAEEFAQVTFGTTGVAAVTNYSGNSNQDNKRIGTTGIVYATSAGPIEVVSYQYQKQSLAFFIANDNFRRIGSTDLTMRPIGGGAEAFFQQADNNAGAQMRIYSNQAPVFEIPYRNFLITNITSPYDVPGG
jgi:hypothetical protein